MNEWMNWTLPCRTIPHLTLPPYHIWSYLPCLTFSCHTILNLPDFLTLPSLPYFNIPIWSQVENDRLWFVMGVMELPITRPDDVQKSSSCVNFLWSIVAVVLYSSNTFLLPSSLALLLLSYLWYNYSCCAVSCIVGSCTGETINTTKSTSVNWMELYRRP